MLCAFLRWDFPFLHLPFPNSIHQLQGLVFAQLLHTFLKLVEGVLEVTEEELIGEVGDHFFILL